MINILNSIYGLAIKYDQMIKLTSQAFRGYNDNQINIFIDLYPIFRTLYKPDYIESNSNVDICAGIVNLAAHYRGFFMRYCKTYSNIYLINSLNLPKRNLELYPKYNYDMKHRVDTATDRMKGLIPFNLDLLDILIPYIEDVYIIHSSYESSVVMYDVICKNQMNGNNHPNLIISRDVYPYQLTGICPNTILYRPYKRGSEDASYFINDGNLFNMILYGRGEEQRDFSNISPKLFSLLFSLNGIKDRKIKIDHNIIKAKRIIEDAIENRIILNDYNSIIDWNNIQTNKDRCLLQRKFECIDIITQHSIYMNDIESNYNLQNLYDPDAVREINNRYFVKNNQLNLNVF